MKRNLIKVAVVLVLFLLIRTTATVKYIGWMDVQDGADCPYGEPELECTVFYRPFYNPIVWLPRAAAIQIQNIDVLESDSKTGTDERLQNGLTMNVYWLLLSAGIVFVGDNIFNKFKSKKIKNKV
jgi:hypothetical protein